LPGIWLLEVEGEKYQGVVKVKVGPVTVWYEGIAGYLLLDADAHKAVLKAEGGEIRGHGKGTALVTATLSPSARGTNVQVVTVLSIDGRLAQFANGVIAAVSRNLMAEFAENLELTVLASPDAATAEPVVETEITEDADKAPAEA
jgi:carbon monoxide dehydrogenase subunit G